MKYRYEISIQESTYNVRAYLKLIERIYSLLKKRVIRMTLVAFNKISIQIKNLPLQKFKKRVTELLVEKYYIIILSLLS